MKIKKIAICGRKADPKWVGSLVLLFKAISRHGLEVCWQDTFRGVMVRLFAWEEDPSVLPKGGTFSSYSDMPDDVDLMLALGGDGTFLNSLTYLRGRQIPVAGINFGRLGFLTSSVVREDGENEWMDRLFTGDFSTEQRPLLEVSCDDMPASMCPYALNEVSVQRNNPNMLGVDLKVNDVPMPTYWADGLVISTPTGSTAYNLSLGGPIMMPGSDVLSVAPIAPHNLNVRPLVIPADSELELRIEAKKNSADFTIDNRQFRITNQSVIKIRKSEYSALCAVISDSSFIGALQEKLFWGEDRRNITGNYLMKE